MGAGDATVSLAEVLRNSGALPEPLIAQLLRLLLPQLVDADASGQLGKNSVRLGADLCRVEPEAKAAGGERLWWSPERCAGGAASEADDVWGVGAMAAECALGIPPALGAAASGRGGAVDPAHVAARLREGTWSAEFCDFVAACLTEDAARRPTLSALQGHQLLAKHAGVEIWAGEGSAQLRLSAAVAEAAVTYLYAVRTAESLPSPLLGAFENPRSPWSVAAALRPQALSAQDDAAVRSLLPPDSVAILSSGGEAHGAQAAEAVLAEGRRYRLQTLTAAAEGAASTTAQTQWAVTVRGMSVAGTEGLAFAVNPAEAEWHASARDAERWALGAGQQFAHRVVVRMASADELVVRRWELHAANPSETPAAATSSAWAKVSREPEEDDAVVMADSDDDEVVYDDDDFEGSDDDDDEYVDALSRPWADLDEEEQEAALALGWEETSWPRNTRAWAPTFDEMDEDDQDNLRSLGFDEESAWPPSSSASGPTAAELRAVFEAYATAGADGAQVLDGAALRKVWGSGELAEWCEKLESEGSFDPGASLLANFDLDANGLVSLAEFGKLFGCVIEGGV